MELIWLMKSTALLMQASSWPLLMGLFTGTWQKRIKFALQGKWCITHFIHQLLANVTYVKSAVLMKYSSQWPIIPANGQLDDLSMQLK